MKLLKYAIIIFIFLSFSTSPVIPIPEDNYFALTIFENTVDFSQWKYEVLKVEFKDGLICWVTSGKKKEININVRELLNMIETLRRRLIDVKALTHNHFESRHFSQSDKAFYCALMLCGFRGEFLIYFKGNLYKI